MHLRKILLNIAEKMAEVWLVASWDVVRQVRRPVFFLSRLAFALVISGQFLWLWSSRFGTDLIDDNIIQNPTVIISSVRSIYTGSMVFLSLGIIFFCPMLTVGCVAGDRERKIWYDLVNSPLSGWSILMGKMAGRLATVFSWVISILPVWAILGLVGGLDPMLVLSGFVLMIAYGWFYAAIGLFASTVTSRIRDAIGLSVAITVAVLGIPLMMMVVTDSFVRTRQYDWIVEAGFALNPVFTAEFQKVFYRNAGGSFWLDPRLIVLIIASLGPLLTLFSGLILRPVSLRMERAESRSERTKERRKRSRNKEIDAFAKSDDVQGFRAIWYSPMAIKERKVRVGSRLVGRFVKLVFFVAVSFAGLFVLQFGAYAFQEMLAFGIYSSGHDRREEFAALIMTISGISHLALMQSLTIDTAGRLISEKESDTWLTLISTPIGAAEVCFGKAIGALWSWRLLVVFILICWTLGILCGALNPILVFLGMFVWMVHIGLALALGLRFGANSRNFQSMLFKSITFWVTIQFLVPFILLSIFDELGLGFSPAIVAAITMNSFSLAGNTGDVIRLFGIIQVLILLFVMLRQVQQCITEFDKMNDRIVENSGSHK